MDEHDDFDRLIATTSVEQLCRDKALEAEVLWADSRLRDFAQTREDLLADDLDPTEEYRRLRAKRDAALEELGNRPNAGAEQGAAPRYETQPAAWPAGVSVLEQDIAPLRLAPDGFVFGSSGFVQMPRATEGVSVTPSHSDARGEITTTLRRVKGGLEFNGVLDAPHDIDNDPARRDTFVWLRTWKHLVPFPAVPTRSILTYRFDVAVNLSVARSGRSVDFMSFVSLGEEPNLTVNSSVEVNVSAGWPLIADLTKPDTFYNGHYGWLFGRTTVQRSFQVQAGSIPAVAVIVGAAAILARRAHCFFNFAGPASIIPQDADDREGRIAYHLTPVQVVA